MTSLRLTTIPSCVLAGALLLPAGGVSAGGTAADKAASIDEERPVPEAADYQQYVSFFEDVYNMMTENYYYDVDRQAFDRFLQMFDTRIYAQLRQEKKSDDYVKWRSAAYLVDALKAPEDIFSAFFPPKAADDFEQEVLGQRVDLGIEGQPVAQGYAVERVEPRSDAFDKGIKAGDVLLRIDGEALAGLSDEAVRTLLTPLEGATVEVALFDAAASAERSVSLISREYFKQTVFMVPVPVPGIYCLRIPRFNRMTAQDLTRFMTYILRQGGESSLIIDLRDNPGGPPLAAREISAFFLPPNEEFAYFQRKDKPRAVLDVPRIPGPYHYDGDMVILVNHKSGSASELFSGILQSRGRAVIMGTNTAGQVFLKSMFHFDDDSMILLVTARGFHPDGTVFSFNGVEPNERFDDPNADLVELAARYLYVQRELRRRGGDSPASGNE